MTPEKRAAEYFLEVGPDLDKVIDAAGKRIGMPLDRRVSPIRTWLPVVDKMTLGFTPGKLYVCGGRPGDGKTSFATTIAANIIRNSNQSILFISTELTPLELILQVGEAYCGGIETAPKMGVLTQNEKDQLEASHEAIQESIVMGRLSILHAKKLSERMLQDAIRHHCRVLNDDKISLVIVDQMNRIARSDKDKHGYAIATEHLLNTLEEVASDHHVPLLLVTQLNRGAEMQNKPTMGNIKHSGALEEYAHCVFLLHRGEGCDAEIIIAKNRDGASGPVPARFYGASHTWCEWEGGL